MSFKYLTHIPGICLNSWGIKHVHVKGVGLTTDAYLLTDDGLTTFETFMGIMAKRMTVPEADDQLITAFRVLDKEGR